MSFTFPVQNRLFFPDLFSKVMYLSKGDFPVFQKKAKKRPDPVRNQVVFENYLYLVYNILHGSGRKGPYDISK